MAQKSFYDVLLVDQTATLDEIKLAFKRRALQVHPDKGGSKEEFHLVYQALETLGEAAARKKYDESLSNITGREQPKQKRKTTTRSKDDHPAANTQRKTKPRMPRRSTTFDRAPSRPHPTPAAPREPQSKQTKLLVKIHDLLNRLPRDTRNDVITNIFSQKQRVALQRWMVDNVYTSSGTQGHLEAKALVPAAGRSASEKMPRCMAHSSLGRCSSEAKSGRQCAASLEKSECNKRLRRNCDRICNEQHNATTSAMMLPSDMQSLASEAAETHSALHLQGVKELQDTMTRGEGCCALAARDLRIGPSVEVRTKRPAKTAKVKVQDKTKRRGKVRGCGYVKRAGGALWLFRNADWGRLWFQDCLGLLGDTVFSQAKHPDSHPRRRFCGTLTRSLGSICHGARTEPCRP